MKNESNLFLLGQVLFSCTINETISSNDTFSKFVSESLLKHKTGNWGDLGNDDKQMNDQALEYGNRIFSSYLVPDLITDIMNNKIWIITEAKDHEGIRRCTTILFPSEY